MTRPSALETTFCAMTRISPLWKTILALRAAPTIRRAKSLPSRISGRPAIDISSIGTFGPRLEPGALAFFRIMTRTESMRSARLLHRLAGCDEHRTAGELAYSKSKTGGACAGEKDPSAPIVRYQATPLAACPFPYPFPWVFPVVSTSLAADVELAVDALPEAVVAVAAVPAAVDAEAAADGPPEVAAAVVAAPPAAVGAEAAADGPPEVAAAVVAAPPAAVGVEAAAGAPAAHLQADR